MRDKLTTAAEITGGALIATAGFLVAVPLGLTVAGVGLIALGWLLRGDG